MRACKLQTCRQTEKMKNNMKFWGMLCAFVMIIASGSWASAAQFANETLRYVVSYKWGLIHKDAGEAVLSVKNVGNNYQMTLVGRTKPWADKFYSVRDTLHATVARDGFRPQRYEKITHEKGKFAKDVITYSYHGSVVGGKAMKYRPDENGVINTKQTNLTASGKAFDMLSVFYYLRIIDYSQLAKGHPFTTTVFSGSKSETLTVRLVGTEDIKLRDKSSQKAYHIKFRFTQAGKKKSSDDIDAWIGVAEPHIPLLITGSLPVGQVRCSYVK